jgi:FeS assembly SUF system protein
MSEAKASLSAVVGAAQIHNGVVEVLKTIYDPEIPVNIYDLGLIYQVAVDDDGRVRIEMTLTSPMCPAAQILPPAVQREASAVPGASEVDVQVVWDPPWSMDRMSEAAKFQLGLLDVDGTDARRAF